MTNLCGIDRRYFGQLVSSTVILLTFGAGLGGAAIAASCSPPPKATTTQPGQSIIVAHVDLTSNEPYQQFAAQRGAGPPQGPAKHSVKPLQFFFLSGNASLSDEDKKKLSSALASQGKKVAYVWVRGFADKTGTKAANEKIAGDRTEAVKAEVLAAGVDESLFCADVIGDNWGDEFNSDVFPGTMNARNVEVLIYYNR